MPQNPVGVRDGFGGSMWHHHEACIKAKQSHEGLVVVICTDQKMDRFAPRVDHFAPEVKWFSKISKGKYGDCVIAL